MLFKLKKKEIIILNNLKTKIKIVEKVNNEYLKEYSRITLAPKKKSKISQNFKNY